MFCKKGVLRNFAKFTGKQACNFIKKETLAQMFSCEFCEISKNTFFHRTPLVAASLKSQYSSQREISQLIGRANHRSSRPEAFCTKDVRKNFAKAPGKHLCQSLFFNKVAGLRSATLLKKQDSGTVIFL